MRLTLYKMLFILGLLFTVILTGFQPTAAQSGTKAWLSPPQIEDYPQITAFLDLHDASGNFVHGLKPDNLSVIENGNTLPVNQVSEIHPGVQFILAFSPGHALSIRDGLGLSRFDYLISGLSAWKWDQQVAGLDDLSLVTVDGPELVHVSNPSTFLSTLQNYQTDLRSSEPNLEVLSRALEIAEDTPPRPGMERAILFITPLQPAEAGVGLQSLSARASQLGVRIFVWLVTSPDSSNAPATLQLQNLADQTGGSLFSYTGSEGIPDLETYLEPLRYVYNITYTSVLTSAGSFPLSVEVTLPDQTLASNSQEITLDIQPPNPIFISPPSEISRKLLNTDQTKATAQLESYPQWMPNEQTIEVLVEFPDGHPRSIVQSALYVDGSLLQTNTTPPFEKFTWDIRSFVESGAHTLHVEVTDSLGLTGRSTEIPVQVVVEKPVNKFRLVLSGRSLLLTGALVASAGTVLVLVLVLGGRIQPHQPGKPSKKKPSRLPWLRRGSTRVEGDPVTQPVKPKNEEPPRSPSHWNLRLQRSHSRSSAQKFAFLTPVLPDDESHQQAPIPISFDEITFGRDPLQSTWVIDDPSLDALHALLVREGNTYRLADAGSTAGTWINFAPISQEGLLLENGDLIHMGRTCFRFSLRAPGKGRKAVILKQEHGL